MKDIIKSFQKEKSQTAKFISIFILLACIFYFDKLILGPYATIRIHDTFDTEFSRYASLGRLFLNNGFFAWNPNIVCGMPAYAYHFPPYYILCLLATVFPIWFLYAALVILLMFVAAYGMYWFLKDFLKVSAELSYLGGLIFSLQMQIHSNSIVNVVFNYAFPMFFMCLITAGKKNVSFKVRLLSMVFVILTLFLSYPVLTLPMFFILQCFVIIFFNFHNGLSVQRMLFKTVLVWAGYILLSMPILYGLYSFIPFCQRSYGQYTAVPVFFASLPNNLIQLFLQYSKDSYLFLPVIGLTPLVFYSPKARRAFLVLMIATFIIIFFQAPLLSVIRGTIFEKMDLGHFTWTIPFLIIVFVVTGIEEFFRIKVAKRLYVFSFLTAGFILFYFMRTAGGITPESLLNITLPLFIFLFCFFLMSGMRKRRLILPAAIILFIIMLGQFKITRILKFENYPYKRFYESQSVFNDLRKEAERAPFRVATTLSFPMVMQSYGLETSEARSPIMPKSYKEFFREIIRPQLQTEKQSVQFDTYWYHLYLRDEDITPYSKNKKSSKGLFNLPLLLMTNTKYIISRYRDPYLESISENVIEAQSDNITKPSLLKDVFKTADEYLNKPFFKRLIPDKIANIQEDSLFKKMYCPAYFVYRLNNYFARGYLAPNAVLLESDNAVLNELTVQTVESLRSNVFFSEKDATITKIHYERQALTKDDKIDLIHYSPDKLIFEGIIVSPRILVITNNYHPNWKAIVNGKEQKIYRANHTFQAVFLEKAGNFNVTLLYKDSLLWKIHWLVLIGIILIIYATLMRTKNNKETN